jgi:flagellar motor switch protein FliG
MDSEVKDIEKAAILLMSIGTKEAAEVLKHLGPKEVQQLSVVMAELKNIDKSKINRVVQSFLELMKKQSPFGLDNDKQVKEVLIKALGESKAKGIIDKISGGGQAKGLDMFRWMDAKSVSEFLKNEHPRVQAIILSYLDPEQSGKILDFFPEDVKTDILIKISQQEVIHPEALEELNLVVEQQLNAKPIQQDQPLGGIKRAAEILNNVAANQDRILLEKIRLIDANIADNIADLMLVFDNLKTLDDKSVQNLLREVSTDVLVIALKGADAEIKEMVFKNMSKRAGELLKDDLEAKGPVKLKEVESAQKEIVIIAKRLAEEGKINLGRNGEEMV